MAINKKVVISYGGKDYEVKMTMEVIDHLESHINLLQMASRLANGDIRYSHAAKLISLLLNISGAKVTQTEVYESMFGADGGSAAGVISAMGDILMTIFPEPKKKQEPQQEV